MTDDTTAQEALETAHEKLGYQADAMRQMDGEVPVWVVVAREAVRERMVGESDE